MPIKRSKFKLCRRVGAPIFEKCQSEKFVRTSKTGKGAPKRMSDYGKQLLEKQKVRFSYGISEKQFKNYVIEAMNTQSPARSLFELLESRLDSAVYRLGLVATRLAARQFVTHGHATVNGRRVDIPSYRLKLNTKISLTDSVKNSKMFENRKEALAQAKSPDWMQFDASSTTATVTGLPSSPDPMLDFQAVIEFYTR